ncbi:hypothetical protein ACF1G2_07435, partial [Streptomyces sp. NPDC013457]
MRIVVLVIVVPVRMVWDVLVVGTRALDRTVLRPTGRALAWLGRALFVRPWVWLWRQAVRPALHYALVVPAAWLYRHVLTPLGHGLAWGLVSLGKALFVWPWVALWRYVVVPVARYGVALPLAWLYRHVLTPLGHGLVRGLGLLGKVLFVWPWVVLWRYVVVPVARYGVGVPAVWVYRWVLAPLGRGVSFLLDRLWRYGVALPVAWLYRHVLTPLGHGLAWGLVSLGKALFVWPWVA